MKNKSMLFCFIAISFSSLSLHASDEYSEPSMIFKDGVAIGYTSAASPMSKPMAACKQFAGKIIVEGLQFSDSGASLKSFWFVDGKDNNWSVPTNFENLPNNLLGEQASNFIKKGKPYFVRLEACGSVSLLDIYNESAITQNIN